MIELLLSLFVAFQCACVATDIWHKVGLENFFIRASLAAIGIFSIGMMYDIPAMESALVISLGVFLFFLHKHLKACRDAV